MKYSGIGGQAVMEGVMMKHKDDYAVAVRTPKEGIVTKKSKCEYLIKNKTIRNLPIVRGVVGFVESLVLGMKTLTYSAEFFEEEEPSKKKETDQNKQKKKDDFWMGMTVVFSMILAIAIFVALPYGISLLLERVISSPILVAFVEGIIRLVIFIGYVAVISLQSDIKRVYMYHGAEHKCINCIEHGMELTVENVRKNSRFHKRCGTSFLLVVMLITIFFFMLIQVESPVSRLVLRLLLIPVIAGVAFEFIRLAGRSDSLLVNMISKPGIWLQKITTREPDDDMIEVGIASVEAVFDWRQYLKEEFQIDGQKAGEV